MIQPHVRRAAMRCTTSSQRPFAKVPTRFLAVVVACALLTVCQANVEAGDPTSTSPPSLSLNGDQLIDQALPASPVESADKRIPVLREAAEVISGQLMALADGMQNIKLLSLNSDKLREAMKDPAFQKAFGKAPEGLMKAGELAQNIYNLKKAWDEDIADNNGIQGVVDHPIVLIHSHTVEQLAQLGLDQMLPKFYEVLEDHKIVPFQAQVFLDGSKIEMGAPTFGAVNLIKAAAGTAGRGYADLDAVTDYFDGAVGLTWGAAGMLFSGGNLRVAQIFEGVGQATAASGRLATRGLAQDITAAQLRYDDQILKMYKTAQMRNKANGKPIQSFDEYLMGQGTAADLEELKKDLGVTDSDEAKAANAALDIDASNVSESSQPSKPSVEASANGGHQSESGQTARNRPPPSTLKFTPPDVVLEDHSDTKKKPPYWQPPPPKPPDRLASVISGSPGGTNAAAAVFGDDDHPPKPPSPAGATTILPNYGSGVLDPFSFERDSFSFPWANGRAFGRQLNNPSIVAGDFYQNEQRSRTAESLQKLFDPPRFTPGFVIANPQGMVSPSIPSAMDPTQRGGVLLHTEVVTNAPAKLDDLFGTAAQTPKPKE